jgi:hypothetical protein
MLCCGGTDYHDAGCPVPELEARVVKLEAALRELTSAVEEERRWATGTSPHADARSRLYLLTEQLQDRLLAAAGEGEATSKRDWVCPAHGTVPESEVAWESHSQIPVHQSPCNRDVEPCFQPE